MPILTSHGDCNRICMNLLSCAGGRLNSPSSYPKVQRGCMCELPGIPVTCPPLKEHPGSSLLERVLSEEHLFLQLCRIETVSQGCQQKALAFNSCTHSTQLSVQCPWHPVNHSLQQLLPCPPSFVQIRSCKLHSYCALKPKPVCEAASEERHSGPHFCSQLLNTSTRAQYLASEIIWEMLPKEAPRSRCWTSSIRNVLTSSPVLTKYMPLQT